jgi:hypothetical protein
MDGRDDIGAPARPTLRFFSGECDLHCAVLGADLPHPSERTLKYEIVRVRSIATLCFFGMAAVFARKYPLLGIGICCCLIFYLKPDVSGAESVQ